MFSNQEAEWSRLQAMAMLVVWVSIAEPHRGHRQETRIQHRKKLLSETKDKPISILNSQCRTTKQEQALLALHLDPKFSNFRVDRKQWVTWKPKLKSICMDNHLRLNLSHKWEQPPRNHSWWLDQISKDLWTSCHSSSVTLMPTFH